MNILKSREVSGFSSSDHYALFGRKKPRLARLAFRGVWMAVAGCELPVARMRSDNPPGQADNHSNGCGNRLCHGPSL